MLKQSSRSNDKNILLGLLGKFDLAAELPSNTKFPRELNVSKKGRVFMVPSLLVYDEKVTYCPISKEIFVLSTTLQTDSYQRVYSTS